MTAVRYRGDNIASRRGLFARTWITSHTGAAVSAQGFSKNNGDNAETFWAFSCVASREEPRVREGDLF